MESNWKERTKPAADLKITVDDDNVTIESRGNVLGEVSAMAMILIDIADRAVKDGYEGDTGQLMKDLAEGAAVNAAKALEERKRAEQGE